jgi:hypothetical protein
MFVIDVMFLDLFLRLQNGVFNILRSGFERLVPLVEL